MIHDWVCPPSILNSPHNLKNKASKSSVELLQKKKSQIRFFQYEKMMDELQILWIFRFLYASCEAMSRCEVASILVAVWEARGLQQTVWRWKSQAMLARLCWPEGFTPECERAWGRQSLVSQKTPYSACPSLSCACLQKACQNRNFFWLKGL